MFDFGWLSFVFLERRFNFSLADSASLRDYFLLAHWAYLFFLQPLLDAGVMEDMFTGQMDDFFIHLYLIITDRTEALPCFFALPSCYFDCQLGNLF